MTETKIELRKLTAAKGMVLTNGTIYKDDFVYLGCNDSADNWHEITETEYNKIKYAENAEINNDI